MRSYLKKNMVKINLNLAAEISKINASPQQIGQVIMNLVNNAVDSITHSPGFHKQLNESESFGGEITIDTLCRGEEVVIRVKDTGPGISKKDMNRIFDPFFTRKKTMGMGVGLSICHGIIEDHKGEIDVASTVGVGTTIVVTLPLISKEGGTK